MKYLPKVALALFVKNEVYDISGWVAWHHVQGVNKFFIYDDHSSDGTYEALMAMSSCVDIEVIKTNNSKETDFFYRQRDSYLDAIEKSKGVYDWVGFLDADEYFSLENDETINSYLSNFENFSAVALSWKIYGSSHRVLRSRLPVYQAYNLHSRMDFNDNRLVKSFVRPDKVSHEYSDPHKFHLEDGLYCNSLGEEFHWDNSTKDVDWRGARINHYICRSMENFVERIRRRFGYDLGNSTVYWDHFNRNEEFSEEKKGIIKKSKIQIDTIKENFFLEFAKSLEDPEVFPVPAIAYECGADVFSLKSAHGNLISLDSREGKLTQNSVSENILFGIVYKNNPNKIYITAIEDKKISDSKFIIGHDNRRNFCYEYILERTDAEDKVYLKSPLNNKYLSCMPNESGGTIDCNRDHPSQWEEFYIEVVEHEPYEYKFIPKKSDDDFVNLKDMISSIGNMSYNDFLISISNMREKDLKFLKSCDMGWVIELLA